MIFMTFMTLRSPGQGHLCAWGHMQQQRPNCVACLHNLHSPTYKCMQRIYMELEFAFKQIHTNSEWRYSSGLDLHGCFSSRFLSRELQSVLAVQPWSGQVLQLVASALVSRPDLAGGFLVLQDLLQLMAGVFWFGGEGSFGNRHPQDVRHHVRAEPANQRGAAGRVVSLSMIEEKPIHLQQQNVDEHEVGCGFYVVYYTGVCVVDQPLHWSCILQPKPFEWMPACIQNFVDSRSGTVGPNKSAKQHSISEKCCFHSDLAKVTNQ